MNPDGGPGGGAGATLWPAGFRAAVALTFDVDARARALGWLIEKITQYGEIWLAPMCEIADRAMAATAAAPGAGHVKMPVQPKVSKS